MSTQRVDKSRRDKDCCIGDSQTKHQALQIDILPPVDDCGIASQPKFQSFHPHLECGIVSVILIENVFCLLFSVVYFISYSNLYPLSTLPEHIHSTILFVRQSYL